MKIYKREGDVNGRYKIRKIENSETSFFIFFLNENMFVRAQKERERETRSEKRKSMTTVRNVMKGVAD